MIVVLVLLAATVDLHRRHCCSLDPKYLFVAALLVLRSSPTKILKAAVLSRTDPPTIKKRTSAAPRLVRGRGRGGCRAL